MVQWLGQVIYQLSNQKVMSSNLGAAKNLKVI